MSLILWILVQADRSNSELPKMDVQIGRWRCRPLWCFMRRPAATALASPMPGRAIVGSGTTATLTANESDRPIFRIVAVLMNECSPLR